jgi:uncharacterized protein YbjQ (UPF0145 family)
MQKLLDALDSLDDVQEVYTTAVMDDAGLTFTGRTPMLLTTTPTLEGRPIRQYHGVVTGEAIIGANIFKDMFASIRNVVGGRAGAYESTLSDAREAAMEDMSEIAAKLGANAIVGIDIDYEVLGADNGMLMVCVSGTAVSIRVRRGN